MVTDMTAEQAPPKRLRQSLLRDCAGNPLFVVSYLLQAVNSGVLQRRNGRWKFAEGALLSLPSSLEALLELRLEELPDDAVQLVTAGAVLGPRFDLRVAAQMVDLDQQSALSAQALLKSRHIVESAAGWDARFSHDKLLERAYRDIDPSRRKQLHARAAAQLARQEQTNTAELASHHRLAGQFEQAFPLLLCAAEQAIKEGRHKAARKLLKDARTLGAGEDKLVQRQSVAERTRFIMLEARCAFAARDHDACGRIAREGLAALGITPPKGTFDWVMTLLSVGGRQLYQRYAPADWFVEQGDARARARTIAYLEFLLSYHFQHRDQSLEQLVCVLSSANWAERGEDWEEASKHVSVVAYVLGFVGLATVAKRWFTRALSWAERSGSDVSALVCRTMESYYLMDQLQWQRAEEVALLLREQCADSGAREQLAWNGVGCTTITWLSGDLEKAREYAEELATLSRFGDLDQTLGEGRVIIAAILLQDGLLERAREEGLDAAAMLQKTGEVILQASCVAVAAAAALREGDFDAARDHCRRVQQLVPTGGGNNFQATVMHQLLPEVLLGLAARAQGASRDDLLEEAEFAINACRKQARNKRLLRPCAQRHTASLLSLCDDEQGAAKTIEQAIATARTAAMPYDEAESLRHKSLNRCVAASEREQAYEAAVAIFQRLGCQWHLAQIEEENHGKHQSRAARRLASHSASA